MEREPRSDDAQQQCCRDVLKLFFVHIVLHYLVIWLLNAACLAPSD